MNILYLTDELLVASTAPAIHVHEVANSLSQRGHTVTVCLPRQSFLPQQNTQYQLISLWCPRFASSVFFQLQMIFVLLRLTFSKKIDVLYVRHNLLLLVPVLFGKLCKLPVVLEVNGNLVPELKTQNPHILNKLLLILGFFSLIESINFRFASHNITVTEGIKRHILETYGLSEKSVTTISNGVNTDFFTPSPRASTSQKFVVGYVGSMYHWQGLSYLIEAAAIVTSTHPEITFKIVGDGTEKEALQDQVKTLGLEKIVDIKDAVPHTEVPALIHSFAVAVSLPSKFRAGATSPFKVYEYLACGTPVIQTNITGVQEEFGDTVEYTDPESAESLAKTITKLYEDPELRTSRSQKGRTFVESAHSWQRVAEKIEHILSAATYRT